MAKSQQAQSAVAAGHQAFLLGPILGSLGDVEIDRLFVRFGNRTLLEVKATTIQIHRDEGIVVIQVVISRLDFIETLGDLRIEIIQRAQGVLVVDFHAQLLQATSASDEIQGDVFAARASGEPRPGAIVVLHFTQAFHGAGRFAIDAIVIEQNRDIAARFCFVSGIAQPRSFLDEQTLEVVVFQ